MAKTNAEHQAAFRQCQAERLAALEQENGELRETVAGLRLEVDDIRAELDRATAGPGCPHPAEAVEAGTCRLCGSEVW